MSAASRLAVLGCLVTREGDRLAELLPEVDCFLPVSEMDRLPEAAAEAFGLETMGRVDGAETERHLFTPPHIAYIKIADGCSNRCSYCTIPSIRGTLASGEPRIITKEALRLVERGVRELVLIAQDTAAYGADCGDGRTVWDLVESISRARAETSMEVTCWLTVDFLSACGRGYSGTLPVVAI